MTPDRRGGVYLVWWCSTCVQRVPQPRWLTFPGETKMAPYHLVGLQDHRIEKVAVLDGDTGEL